MGRVGGGEWCGKDGRGRESGGTGMRDMGILGRVAREGREEREESGGKWWDEYLRVWRVGRVVGGGSIRDIRMGMSCVRRNGRELVYVFTYSDYL